MLKPFAFAITAISLSGLAQAEPLPPPSEQALADAHLILATSDAWVERPGVRDFMEAFPRRALENGVDGLVSLECLVREDYRLACLVREESPPNRGFAAAALSMTPKLRIAPVLSDGQQTRGGRLVWDVNFATTGRAAVTGRIDLGESTRAVTGGGLGDIAR